MSLLGILGPSRSAGPAPPSAPSSMRLNYFDDAYTARTMSTGDSKTWTFSTWVKRGKISAETGSVQCLLGAYTNASNYCNLYFNTTDKLELFIIVGGVTKGYVLSDMVFRDVSAWYHIVVSMDAANGTAANRFLMWVNGVAISINASTTIANESNLQMNLANGHAVGRRGASADQYFDGYVANTTFVDGTVYDATDFGEFDVNGHWVPIEFVGTIGTPNGFLLNYADDTDFGKDSSGNSNDFTDSGLAPDDQRTDTPDNNHCVFNSLDLTTGAPTFANGNIAILAATGSWGTAIGSVGLHTGKWYYEVEIDALPGTDDAIIPGWAGGNFNKTNYPGSDLEGWSIQFVGASSTIWVLHNGGASSLTATGSIVAGDRIMCAIDVDNGDMWWGLNGTWFDSGDPAAGTGAQVTGATVTGGQFSPAVGIITSGNVATGIFDAAYFDDAPPSGFSAINSANMLDADYAPILTPTDYFDIRLWTGTGTSPRNPFNDLDFAPDQVYIKRRSTSGQDRFWQTITPRYTGPDPASDWNMSPKNSNGGAPGNAFTAGGMESASSNGINVEGAWWQTLPDSIQDVNGSGETYIAWCWKKGTVPGFDLIRYVGNQTARTLAHGLGQKPDFMWVKAEDRARGWTVYSSNKRVGGTGVPDAAPQNSYNVLEDSDGDSIDGTVWNNTAPTASVITLGTSLTPNETAYDYFGCLWANIPGFFYQGSYDPNGSADGPFLWCGFRPKMVTFKSTLWSGAWIVMDSTRGRSGTTGVAGGNPVEVLSTWDGNQAESGPLPVDFLSNGVKIRTSSASINDTNNEFMYFAWAENPFKYARAG